MLHDQSDAAPESDFSEAPIASQSHRFHLRSRTLVNVATIGVVIAVLAASSPWWTTVAGNVWQRVIPPPPYTGSLIFEDNGLTLTARATTDGRMIWHAGSIQPNSAFLRDGSVLYVYPAGQQHLIAIRLSDGHQLWEQPIPHADTLSPYAFGFVGSDAHNIYIANSDSNNGTVNLSSFDKQTGKPGTVVSGLIAATLDTAHDLLAYCEGVGNNHRVTVMDSDARRPLWQRVLPGRCIGLTMQSSLVVDDATSPDQQFLHFTVLNRQTGTTLWQADIMTSEFSFNSTTIIVGSHPQGDPTLFESFTAIDMTSGKQLWSQALKGSNFFLFAFSSYPGLGTTILNTNGTSTLLELDERSGATLWSLPTTARADDPRTRLAVANTTTLYFADSERLRAIDLATGAIRWQSAEAGVPTSLEIQGQTLFDTEGKQLIARDVNTGKIRWQRSVSPLTQLCGEDVAAVPS